MNFLSIFMGYVGIWILCHGTGVEEIVRANGRERVNGGEGDVEKGVEGEGSRQGRGSQGGAGEVFDLPAGFGEDAWRGR